MLICVYHCQVIGPGYTVLPPEICLYRRIVEGYRNVDKQIFRKSIELAAIDLVAFCCGCPWSEYIAINLYVAGAVIDKNTTGEPGAGQGVTDVIKMIVPYPGSVVLQPAAGVDRPHIGGV